MWKVVRENPRAVIYAVLMHLVLLALLMIGLDWTPSAIQPATTQPIEATLVDQSQLKAVEDRKLAEQQKAQQLRKQKAEAARKAEQLKKQKAEAARKAEQLRKQKAEAARKAKQKAAAESKRKAEQLAKQKAAAESKRKAEQSAKEKAEAARKAEQLAKQKAEAERLQKEQAARQREAEQALQAEIAAEQLRQQQARDQGIVAEYVSYIQDKVERNWIRPPGSTNDFSCVVQVALIPGGDVASARVLQSCGNAVLDRSVELAVVKSAPLPVPPDQALFHHFRELKINFRPID